MTANTESLDTSSQGHKHDMCQERSSTAVRVTHNTLLTLSVGTQTSDRRGLRVSCMQRRRSDSARRLVIPPLADATGCACVAPCAPVAAPCVEVHLGVVYLPAARVVVERCTVAPVCVAQRARVVSANPRIGAGDACEEGQAAPVNSRASHACAPVLAGPRRAPTWLLNAGRSAPFEALFMNAMTAWFWALV